MSGWGSDWAGGADSSVGAAWGEPSAEGAPTKGLVEGSDDGKADAATNTGLFTSLAS